MEQCGSLLGYRAMWLSDKNMALASLGKYLRYPQHNFIDCKAYIL